MTPFDGDKTLHGAHFSMIMSSIVIAGWVIEGDFQCGQTDMSYNIFHPIKILH